MDPESDQDGNGRGNAAITGNLAQSHPDMCFRWLMSASRHCIRYHAEASGGSYRSARMGLSRRE
jgi:hypothetical protein